MERLLIIDDEIEMLSGCKSVLTNFGYSVFTVDSGSLAAQLIQNQEFDLILCDLMMPEVDGFEIIKTVKQYAHKTPVIILTAFATIERAVKAMKLGAFNFLEKPFESTHLKTVVENGLKERARLREQHTEDLFFVGQNRFDDIIGNSNRMQHIFSMVDSVAKTDANILITGESGTGKELIARSIHSRSLRSKKAFVPVNCGAFPENLFEAELFGYEKGSFTGAVNTKIGLLEFADGGTFFLDEVCEFPLTLQTKLLRVLQDRYLRHIGGNELIKVDVRLISATNRDLQTHLSEGLIREDFYYRLNVINIHLPPLREREGDMPILAQHFLNKTLKMSNKSVSGFSDEVMDRFEKYNWPGNVRELENVIERAVALVKGDLITMDELPPQFQYSQEQVNNFENSPLSQIKNNLTSDLEKKYIIGLLKSHKGNITKTAATAGVTRRTIHRMLKKYKIDPNIWRK